MSSERISGLMWIPSVYGWNPAPVDRHFIPLFTGCYTSQVVQDFLPSTIAFSWSKDHLASPLENWANAVSSHPSIKSPHPARPSIFDARETVSTTLVWDMCTVYYIYVDYVKPVWRFPSKHSMQACGAHGNIHWKLQFFFLFCFH